MTSQGLSHWLEWYSRRTSIQSRSSKSSVIRSAVGRWRRMTASQVMVMAATRFFWWSGRQVRAAGRPEPEKHCHQEKKRRKKKKSDCPRAMQKAKSDSANTDDGRAAGEDVPKRFLAGAPEFLVDDALRCLHSQLGGSAREMQPPLTGRSRGGPSCCV